MLSSQPAARAARPARDWTPVLRGSVYCSPACGGSCARAAFDLCTKRAAALAKQLGPGWSPRVHENLGWFYSADNGNVRMSPDSTNGGPPRGYTLFVNSVSPQVVADGASPRETLELGLAKMSQIAALLIAESGRLRGGSRL